MFWSAAARDRPFEEAAVRSFVRSHRGVKPPAVAADLHESGDELGLGCFAAHAFQQPGDGVASASGVDFHVRLDDC
jgi:hypothetical protein